MSNPTLAPGYSLHPDGYLLVPLQGKHGNGKFAKVDFDDYRKVVGWRWYVNLSGYSYGQRHTPERVRLQVFLHHLVFRTPAGLLCDHINGDPLDARKGNLRLASYNMNNRNRPTRSTTSKYKGITLDKRRGRWQVRTNWQGRHWNFGSYKTPEEAARVYDAATLFIDPGLGDQAINFPGVSQPISPWDLRRKAFEDGNIRRQSSQFKGVHWKAKNKAFQAFYTVDDKTIYLGLHDSEEAAARAHDSYALHLGNSDVVNFVDATPRTQEEILEASLRRTRPPQRRPKGKSRHGYAGVVFHTRACRKPWQARLHLGGKRISVGYFETLEEAARAYDAALVNAGFEPVNF